MGSQNPFIEIVGSNPKIVIPPWHLGFWKKILKKISILTAILLSADRSKQSYILRTSQINQLQRFPNRNPYCCGQTNQNCLNRKLNEKTKPPLKKIPTIHNIDLNDQHDPQLVSEYLPSIFP